MTNQIPLLTAALLTGRDDNFIDHASLERPVHRDLVGAFRRLRQDASAAGFDLAIASGYRDYSRQLAIWNAKARGERPVFDSDGVPLQLADLDEWTQVQAILRWSALPGASRHHWGTDIDVYDRAAVPDHYRVLLTPEEVAPDGPFGPLHRWLDQRIAEDASYGFFRPYDRDRGGIAPERWHLSYAPTAARYQRQLRAELLLDELDGSTLALRDTVRRHWTTIYERFVWVPAEYYPAPQRARLLGS
ncbi:MAG TPA: M15 family metallopeptidase [Spongiibacteraceae bacterium]|nr:M15 family metallopeptidase [Spongiibacteraceae bacterium]